MGTSRRCSLIYLGAYPDPGVQHALTEGGSTVYVYVRDFISPSPIFLVVRHAFPFIAVALR